MKIKFKKLHKEAYIPAKLNQTDSGWDIRSCEQTIIRPYSCAKIRTGIAIEIPEGYEFQIRGKDNLALNENITIASGIGTINNSFKDEICVLLYNQAPHIKRIEKGVIIAQLVLSKVYDMQFQEVEEFADKPNTTTTVNIPIAKIKTNEKV